ncbi:MAG: sulfite exporter TauE/SafE family protein [Methylophilaceae bacterium]
MKLRHVDLSANPVNDAHEALGLPPIEEEIAHPSGHPYLRIAVWLAIFMLIGAVGYLSMRLISFSGNLEGAQQIIYATLQSEHFWSAVAVGLIAQTIDGALGMAYGLTSNTFLLASGIPPAVATASVHIAEVFTTGVSGISHVKMKNVNVKLFLRLLVPGMIGALTGVVVVSSIDGALLKPFISIYLLIMGLYLVSKAFRHRLLTKSEPKHVGKLALFGGFVDAVGGGGWGPVVTTTLVGSGHDPRTTIGSVNFAEFFLTFVSAIAFSVLVGEGPWPVVAGLVLGGVFAAPIAAMLTRKIPAKKLLVLVGILICLVSLVSLYKAFFA